MRATAATNALDNGADIAKVQEWLGHANIATTRIYDRRKTRPEDSTFKGDVLRGEIPCTMLHSHIFVIGYENGNQERSG